MAYRILHCGKSLTNYYICIEQRVAGFINRSPETGDTVFIAVKVGKETLCGARGKLGEITDTKPWEDADRYPHVLILENVEFCQPFKLKVLEETGGKYWSLKYVQGSKPIVDRRACELLDQAFETNRTDSLIRFSQVDEVDEEETESEADIGETDIDEVVNEVPDAKINIMGTFLTINFLNESDKLKGLEALVNENFYSLFPQYPENRTLLIPENRLFRTIGIDRDGSSVAGIRTIPDALLLVFNRQSKYPLQINLIEYEAYGERKVRSLDKSNYLNGQIIPQLMKFASTFSIVTDKHIREETIKDWADKIIDYVWRDAQLQHRMTGWIRELKPELDEKLIGLEIDKMVKSAFKNSVRVLLIIDELSTEQKDTIANVIKAFKLENGESTQFLGYIVRLVQKINVMDQSAEYALTVQ